MKFLEKIKLHFKEVLALKKDPQAIALGFSIGTLIALLPTFGFGILLGLIIMAIFKNISKISMFAAFAILNPLVLIPFYTLSQYLGNFLLGSLPITDIEFTFLQNFYHYSLRFLLGNLIIALAVSIASYFIIYFIAKKQFQNI
jgi:uncharacterized protein (DUF2062 family)